MINILFPYLELGYDLVIMPIIVILWRVLIGRGDVRSVDIQCES